MPSRISTIESELQGVYKASTYNEQVTEMHEAWKVGNKRVGSSIKTLTGVQMTAVCANHNCVTEYVGT